MKGQNNLWHKLVWHRNTTPRCSFILWLTMLNRLKTRDLMQRRHLNIQGGCLFCPEQIEDCKHLFFKCPCSAAIWKNVLNKVGIRRIPQQWASELNWLRKTAPGRNRKARTIKSLLAASVYYTWAGWKETLGFST